MRKKIGVILCICFLTGLVSGCGAQAGTVTESNNLTEKDKAATVEENSEPETIDTAESGNDQSLVTEKGTGEITMPEEEPEFWGADYILEISVGYGNFATQEDIIHIGQCSHLKHLQIMIDERVTDLTPLENLNQLTELTFDTWLTVKDLSYFQDMRSLQSLYITYVDDVDLNYLSELKNLESLTITGHNIRNIEGIGDLINLKELYLCDNSLDAMYGETEPLDIRSLENLTQLERIELEFIHFDDITPLAELKRLRSITLANTNVEDISPLIGLENLEWLHIYGNESELVKEQAETYFSEIGDMFVTEKRPNGY